MLTRILLLACAFMLPAGAIGTCPQGTLHGAQAALTTDESLLLQLINEERASHRLPRLILDPVLSEAARRHSADMGARGYFSHLAPAPGPRTPLDRYAALLSRTPDRVVGENIGLADQPVMSLIHEGMMESPDHRANLLDVEYLRVGIGAYQLAEGRIWVTEMFSG
jgi:uncharacterized protein YkwD